jgi:hypothetical protein
MKACSEEDIFSTREESLPQFSCLGQGDDNWPHENHLSLISDFKKCFNRKLDMLLTLLHKKCHVKLNTRQFLWI